MLIWVMIMTHTEINYVWWVPPSNKMSTSSRYAYQIAETFYLILTVIIQEVIHKSIQSTRNNKYSHANLPMLKMICCIKWSTVSEAETSHISLAFVICCKHRALTFFIIFSQVVTDNFITLSTTSGISSCTAFSRADLTNCFNCGLACNTAIWNQTSILLTTKVSQRQ